MAYFQLSYTSTMALALDLSWKLGSHGLKLTTAECYDTFFYFLHGMIVFQWTKYVVLTKIDVIERLNYLHRNKSNQ